MRVRAWAFALLIAAAPAVAAPPAGAPEAKIAPWLIQHLSGGTEDSFIVLFDAEPGAPRAAGRPKAARQVYDRLRQRAVSSQGRVRAELRSAAIPFRSLYLVNGLAVHGGLGLARRLAAHDEVIRVVGDPLVRGVESDLLAPVASSPDTVEWGITKIDADKVWSLDGVHGEGIVIASADTGVEWNHPALLGKYRGWNGTTADHNYNWFDSIQDLAVPLDDYGHGTHTTGTAVGDDGAGNQIGVAPGARWIACRNMDHGNGRPSTYIACNQFFLAPFPHGGDPEIDGDPSKAPDIINNSWGCPPSEGCDPLTLESSFAALADAGILAVVSAGNAGPNCSTVVDPPSIYAESFVIGASDSTNVLASFSSRGPVTIDGSNRLRPDVAAPGVNVRSSVPGATYGVKSGTSMSSPHVSGATALLWSAKPQIRGLIDITRCVITQTSRPVLTLQSPQTCGGTTQATRPNNFWGFGLIDAYDAIHAGPDTDGDGIIDACDCAAGDGGAYDTPSEVEGVGFAADKVTVVWASLARQAGSGTVYDVVEGDLGTLLGTGSIGSAACLGTAGTGLQRATTATPSPGAGLYYLVQARNNCGIGGFGSASSGAPRTHAVCP